ncbi:futalosine hydrolase [Natronosporangium hydrolyticum]|uniref:futalosine hydrolase n=1 Tax=Natronosporangium hydrolyticum TaxID=2811111 RepID=UPI001EFA1C66|nr:futalosine hydrolase [Natronosporangium hydrolyticum]
MNSPILVAAAVAAERDAIRAGLPTDATSVTVEAVGVGPAAAAAGTARLLALAEAAGHPYRTVISAGIAGGFAGHAGPGELVIAARSSQADLGAESPEGWLPLDELGWGSATVAADPQLLAELSDRLPEAVIGDVLTLATVTGTAARAAALVEAHPRAAAEAMEGYGVACAAATAGAAFAELRAISNLVGPRDRGAWRIKEALAALTTAAKALA